MEILVSFYLQMLYFICMLNPTDVHFIKYIFFWFLTVLIANFVEKQVSMACIREEHKGERAAWFTSAHGLRL